MVSDREFDRTFQLIQTFTGENELRFCTGISGTLPVCDLAVFIGTSFILRMFAIFFPDIDLTDLFLRLAQNTHNHRRCLMRSIRFKNLLIGHVDIHRHIHLHAGGSFVSGCTDVDVHVHNDF